MPSQTSASQRPVPTPKPKLGPSNQATPIQPTEGDSNALSQGEDSNRRQTRRTAASAARKPGQPVNFVSGGMIAGDDSGSVDHPEDPATNKDPAATGMTNRKRRRPNAASTKKTLERKAKRTAGAAGQKDNTEGASTRASPSPSTIQPPADSATLAPVKVVKRAKAQQPPGNDTDSLDQAPYRFEGSQPTGGDAPPETLNPQPTPSSPRPVQPALPPFAQITLPEGFKDVQQPDPNNFFDRLRYSEELTTRLLQEYATRQRDPQPSRVSSPRPPTPRPPKKHTNDVRKTANPASALSAQGRRNPRPQPAKLTAIPQLKTIPKPHCKDRTPLDLAMGLRNRFDTYIRIRDRVQKIFLSTGIDWSQTWTRVPSRDKAMLYEMVRAEVPYMGRFEEDWATARIASDYAAHLRSKARERDELKPNPHYAYLKDNSAKRSKDAQRGVRPGVSKARRGTDQVPGPSGASSSEPNLNTASDEDMMDAPGLYGSRAPSDDEGGSGLDDDPDFEKHD